MSMVTETTSTAATYGLFALGPTCVALPLTVVREGTPCPTQLAAIPASAPGLLGVMNLRGQVIAVLDLLALNGTPPVAEAARPEHRVIVVVVHEGKLLGLVVDTVHGVSAPKSLQEIGAEGGGLPVSHIFTDGDGEADGIVSVLDVASVFSLPGVPVVRDDRDSREAMFTASSEEGTAGDESASRPEVVGAGARVDAVDLSGSILLLRCAEHLLAVGIDAVHTILPRVRVRNSPLKHGSCRGVTDFGGAEIPVFDPLALTGLGVLSGEDTEGVAVRFREGVVVMMLTEVLELIPASAARRYAVPTVQVPGRRYVQNVLRVPGRGDFLTLAMQEILEHDDLKALSRLNNPATGGTDGLPTQRSGQDTEETEGSALAGGTYLTFQPASVGRDLAAPLDQVVEILPFPEQYSVVQAGEENVLGLFTHRETVVPLFRLAGLLGMMDDQPPAYVLVVSAGDEPGPDGRDRVVGLVVHALRAIERSVWEDPAIPDIADDPVPSLEEALGWRRMIRLAPIGTSDEPRMLPRANLSAMGAALVPQDPPDLLDQIDQSDLSEPGLPGDPFDQVDPGDVEDPGAGSDDPQEALTSG